MSDFSNPDNLTPEPPGTLACGWCVEEQGYIRVDTRCAEHVACDALCDDCEGLSVHHFAEDPYGKCLVDLCEPCKRWFDNREPADSSTDYFQKEIQAHRDEQARRIKYDWRADHMNQVRR